MSRTNDDRPPRPPGYPDGDWSSQGEWERWSKDSQRWARQAREQAAERHRLRTLLGLLFILVAFVLPWVIVGYLIWTWSG
jgi:hypothetical protein